MRRPVAVLLLAAAAALFTPPTASAEPPAQDHVVIVGIPGLVWSDVTEAGTPQLWSAAGDGSIGAMTVRAARSTTCVLDGWVTLGAGNRARFIAPPIPLDVQPAPMPDPALSPVPADDLRGCLPQETGINLSAVVAALDASPGVADDNSFGAQPGALGAAVECATGVGRGPVLALHREDADTELVAAPPTTEAAWAEVIERCPLTVVSLPELVAPVDRADALAALDARLGLLRASLPERTELMVLGISETGLNSSALHVAVELGPGVEAGFLRSASTGRTPFVQLIDIAPTALDRLGIAPPGAMSGQPLLPGQPRPESLTEAIAHLTDVDLAARTQGQHTSRFFLWLVVGSVLLCAGGLIGLLRRPGPAIRGLVRLVALAAATLPAATFLANLVPWWRAGSPGTALAAAVLVPMAVIVALALAGPWGERPLGPACAVAVVTLATLAADVLVLDSRLQLSSLLGYNPIVAGRFNGFGNIPFGLYAAGGLLTVTALVRAAPAARQRLVLVLGAVAVVLVDGTPGLGSDFGGVLALVPAFVVVGLTLNGSRPSVFRLALAGLAGAAVVGVLAVVDYLRPSSEQTHLGRFVGQLLDGSAGLIVARKAQANLDILTGSPLTLLVPVFGVTLWLLLRRGGPLAWVLSEPVLRAGLAGLAVAGVIGFLVNDSGIAVPVAGGWLVVPLALAVAAGAPRRAAAQEEAAEPAGDRAGVTVNSRDSAGPVL